MNCPNCGAPVEHDDRFCGECGTDLTQHAAVSSSKTSTPQHTHTSHNDYSETVHSQTNTQPSQSNQQPTFDKEKFNQQANEIKHEGSSFFSKLFKSHDSVVSENRPFSLKFVGILSPVFLIITLITLTILIPKEVNMIGYGITKSGLVTKSFFGILLFIVIGYAALAGVTRLIIKDHISFAKLLSDYVFINTFSFIFFILGVLLFRLEIYSLGLFLTFLGIISFYATAIYLLTKYSSFHAIRIPVFFGVVIYLVIQIIVISIYGEMLRNTFMGIFSQAMEDLLPFGGDF